MVCALRNSIGVIAGYIQSVCDRIISDSSFEFILQLDWNAVDAVDAVVESDDWIRTLFSILSTSFV